MDISDLLSIAQLVALIAGAFYLVGGLGANIKALAHSVDGLRTELHEMRNDHESRIRALEAER